MSGEVERRETREDAARPTKNVGRCIHRTDFDREHEQK